MNIYIGNLPHQYNEEEITTLFQEFGEVTSLKLIKDRYTNQLKGFGFLEMEQSCGIKAISELNNHEFRGNRITVSEAKPKNDNNRSYGRY